MKSSEDRRCCGAPNIGGHRFGTFALINVIWRERQVGRIFMRTREPGQWCWLKNDQPGEPGVLSYTDTLEVAMAPLRAASDAPRSDAAR